MAVDEASQSQLRRDEQASALDAQTINTAIFTKLLEVHTAVPGIVDAFDAEKQTVRVRPALKMLYIPDPEANAGDARWIERALCVDVPVVFPGNADYMLTFPVKQGDECLLVFSERCIDDWFTEGGVQQQADMRHHDASDAIAIMGLRSQPNRIANFDNANLQLRDADGDTVVTLDENGKITAGVNGATMTIEDGKITVHADNIKLDGKVEITGTVTGHSTATFTGDVRGQGKSLATHAHSGVQTGGGSSGPPV